MAFAAVTILMDTLHQHFLQPTPRFPLRNKTKVKLLYKHLSSLQTSLEQDFKVGECDEAMKALEAQVRDVSIELRFQIEEELGLFYLGKSMKLRLHSAKKLLPILSRAKEDIETIYRDLNEDDIETMDLESFVLRMVESMDFNEDIETDLESLVVQFAGKHVTLPVSKKLRLRWAQEFFHTLNGVVKGGDLKYVMEMLWMHFTLPVSKKLRLRWAQEFIHTLNGVVKGGDLKYVMEMLWKHFTLPGREDEWESEDEQETEEETEDEQETEEETDDKWESKEEQKNNDEQRSKDEQETKEETKDEWENKEEQKSEDEQRSKDEQEESDDELETEVSQPILIEAESIIRQELRAPSYLNKYMKQRIQARHKIHQIFMKGIKLTSYIKKEVLKVKNAHYNESNTPQGSNTSASLTVGDSLQHTTIEMKLDAGFCPSTNEPLNIWGLPQLKNLTLGKSIRLVPPRSVHHNLESIIYLDHRNCTEELFMRVPNLRRLGVVAGCKISLKRKAFNWFESLACLYKLEDLLLCGKLLHLKFSTIHSTGTLNIENFLPNLKRLKLLDTRLNWKNMYVVGMLPKLEVLILGDYAAVGGKWKLTDSGFPGLKFLIIEYCDLHIWKATGDHFPVLECLVLMKIYDLKKIPSDFADITTLKSIKLYECSKSATSSAKCIQREKLDYGNDAFTVDILERLGDFDDSLWE
nr:putative disease resistance RPP13-like protein 3 [Ipomoea batatas]